MNKFASMTVLRILVFLAGAVYGFLHEEELWVVGPVFGAVVIFWDWSLSGKPRLPQYAVFLGASTLIYALVVRMVRDNFMQEGLPDYVVPGIIAGTVLLPLAHCFLLGASWKRAVIAIPCVYIIATAAGILFDRIDVSTPTDRILNMLAVWQTAYLAFFFLITDRGHKS